MKVYHWVDQCWGRLFQPCCVVCLAPGSGGLCLCADCMQDLPWHQQGCRVCGDALPGTLVPGPVASAGRSCGRCLGDPPSFDRVIAALAFAPPVAGWIRRFKYHGTLYLGRLLSELFLLRCTPPRLDLIVPVPLHRDRQRLRGFNQSAELARPLARALEVPLEQGLLERCQAGIPQSTLLARDRRRAMRGVFRVRQRVAGARIALMDDVLTTGATANACARALKRAGAAEVQVWVISRA